MDKPDFFKWYLGWQPFAMAGLIWFFKNVLQGDVSYLILFVLSFLPSIYIWSENQREQAAGKMDFSIEDTFHDRPTEYSSPLKMHAMYPRIDERFCLLPGRSGVWKDRDGDIKKTYTIFM